MLLKIQMSTLVRSPNPGISLGEEDRSRLRSRVFNSICFQRCPRLRELFLYLCNIGPGGTISEHQIGVDVFKRLPDYDASVDTIARVQVSQLRKKLEQYFLTEGAAEPAVIDFPRGSYAPVFRVRDVADRSTPALDQFWTSLFPAGHDVELVLADGNLMIISDLMNGHLVTLDEYRSRAYPVDLIHRFILDTQMQAATKHISGTHLTSLQDAEVVRSIVPLGVRYHFPTMVVHARDFRMQAAPGNLILIGHKKGNPWIEPFEPQMNFRYDYIASGGGFRAVLINTSPRAGEEEQYVVEYEKHGYALLAHLAKPLGDGEALLISGTDLSSIAAAGRFVTNEKNLAGLLDLLNITPESHIPYFEVLLRTRLLVNTAPGFEVIAHRILGG
jgi:hypothetical protein